MKIKYKLPGLVFRTLSKMALVCSLPPPIYHISHQSSMTIQVAVLGGRTQSKSHHLGAGALLLQGPSLMPSPPIPMCLCHLDCNPLYLSSEEFSSSFLSGSPFVVRPQLLELHFLSFLLFCQANLGSRIQSYPKNQFLSHDTEMELITVWFLEE